MDTTMLAAMREAIGELLPDTCTILSVTDSPDGMGGVTHTWGTASTSDFRLDVISGREQIAGGGAQSFTSYKGSLPYDTVITETNRIVHNGVTYAITNVNNNQSWVAVRRVDLEKV
jgi:hypothetical protein